MKSIIIGAGTYGQTYASYMKEAGIEVVGFVDDKAQLWDNHVCGLPVIGGLDELSTLKHSDHIEAVYCPLGDNKRRVELLEKAISLGYRTPNFIHSTANLARDIEISDQGVYILASAVVMPLARIESFAMMCANSVLGHHAVLGQGVFLSISTTCGASVEIEKYAYCGIGSTIMTGVEKLGEDCMVGAGAVVIRDVPKRAVVVGTPAKIIKYKDE